MELIIDSADVAQIKVLKELCTVAGVTTNPNDFDKIRKRSNGSQFKI